MHSVWHKSLSATWLLAVSFQCDLTVKNERQYNYNIKLCCYLLRFPLLWNRPAFGMAASEFGLPEHNQHVKEQDRSRTGYTILGSQYSFWKLWKGTIHWLTHNSNRQAAADRRPPGPCPWCLNNGPARGAHTAPGSWGTAPYTGNEPQASRGPPRRNGPLGCSLGTRNFQGPVGILHVY